MVKQAGKEPSDKAAFKVIIIGGVAAGPKVASKVIRLLPETDVTIIEKGEFLSYAGCGLPYFIAGYAPNWRSKGPGLFPKNQKCAGAKSN